jgi:hypothetical protein
LSIRNYYKKKLSLNIDLKEKKFVSNHMEKKNTSSQKVDEKQGPKEVKAKEEIEESPENLIPEKDEERPEIKDFRRFIGCGG